MSGSSPSGRKTYSACPNAALRFRPPGVEVDRTQRSGGGPGGAGPGGGGPGGGRGAPGSGRGGGSGLPGRVFIVGADGKPEAVQIRLGITDGTNTEVVEGPLKDKQEVIVGATGPRPTPRRRRPAPGSCDGAGAHRGRGHRQGLHFSERAGSTPCAASRSHRVRRVRRGHGSLGLGQVHLHEPPRLPRHAERRALRPRRRGCLEPGDRTPSPGSETRRSDSSSRRSICFRGRRPSRTSSCRCSTAGSRPRSGRRAPGPSSRRSDWPTGATITRRSSRAASSSAWRSRGPSSTIRY